ncbi:NADH:ubiquinone reductase (Na(+)-transporting) subunit C [Psittacicella hinzii]|uniref:Na(+)-translocating NADH-quinone reductase subunit C n=1 Tax=Psittacicella hinzii TaxID=2028575 RepID=A0A3A1YF54_9GAMM|nr:NADH:ubiquinone reductase (Na(+)-transporting) subunit C [Psittacicella hinzii]RIY36792.1 NADH:ubiquinone reductase (Na(+)-transporting) subunit C [Psittacicella hinzii]
MALNKNSTLYVTGFVAIVSVVCAFIVALAASVLKPQQDKQIAENIQKFVLKVSDISYTNENLGQEFNKYIETRYLDRKTGKLVEVSADLANNYDDILILNKFKQYVSTISSAENTPGLKSNAIADILRIYLVKDPATNQVTKVVLPFYGNGLWSVMYGLLAVDTNGNTIKGITYYSQGETPGLGGEVENPNFTKQFVNKNIYDLNSSDPTDPKIQLVKNANPNDPYTVNALTGATLTSNGVNNQLSFWFGKLGYAQFLNNLRNGEVNLNGK